MRFSLPHLTKCFSFAHVSLQWVKVRHKASLVSIFCRQFKCTRGRRGASAYLGRPRGKVVRFQPPGQVSRLMQSHTERQITIHSHVHSQFRVSTVATLDHGTIQHLTSSRKTRKFVLIFNTTCQYSEFYVCCFGHR